MDPSFWGPGLWKYIHTAAAASDTPQKRDAFHQFSISLMPTIPCGKCKQHFEQNLKKYDIRSYKKNQETLLLWTFLMHDAVNMAQGKTGEKRPGWLVVRSQYFDIPDDQSAVGPSPPDQMVCEEICGGQMVALPSSNDDIDSTQKTRKILSRNNNKRH
jgi:hypothetical protein